MRYCGVTPESPSSEVTEAAGALRQALAARKRSVYLAFLVLAAVGSLASLVLNLMRPQPDPATTIATLTMMALFGSGALLLRSPRLPLRALEGAAFAIGSVALLAVVGYATFGDPDVAMGRVTVQATLHWVPLVFAFAFVAFEGRLAMVVSAVLVAAIAGLTLPHGFAQARDGLPEDLFLVLQAVAAYAVLLAALRFFADLNALTETLQGTAARMRALAHTDALTGLANRRQADAWLRREVQRSQRYGRPFSVLMLDLDRFKRVNDEHGHPAGDFVLVDLGNELERSVRGSDAVARWGGEEFLVLLPETDLDAAVGLAEQLRVKLGKHPLGDGHVLTVSIGVASFRSGDRAEDLVARADAALYAAKRSGRDAVRAEIPPA